jgi:hypothetical protein
MFRWTFTIINQASKYWMELRKPSDKIIDYWQRFESCYVQNVRQPFYPVIILCPERSSQVYVTQTIHLHLAFRFQNARRFTSNSPCSSIACCLDTEVTVCVVSGHFTYIHFTYVSFRLQHFHQPSTLPNTISSIPFHTLHRTKLYSCIL